MPKDSSIEHVTTLAVQPISSDDKPSGVTREPGGLAEFVLHLETVI